jgi:[ribosomal protein S18]-alanine N-acetyltransferase
MPRNKTNAGPIVIRRAAPADAEALMLLEASYSNSPWSETAFVNDLENPRGASFVAFDASGGPCAFIIGVVILDELHVHNLGTMAALRKRGIATRLLEASIAQALSEGALRAFLEVRSKNFAAVRLYEKSGFVSQLIRKKYYADDGDDALVMTKTIAPHVRGRSST